MSELEMFFLVEANPHRLRLVPREQPRDDRREQRHADCDQHRIDDVICGCAKRSW